MLELIAPPHLAAPDDFHETLIEVHSNLETAESPAINARLVLAPANHIGSLELLRQALQMAHGGVQ